MGVGSLSMAVPLYNAEIAPPEVRGSLVALQQLAITFGIMISFWIDYGRRNQLPLFFSLIRVSSVHRRNKLYRRNGHWSTWGCLEDPSCFTACSRSDPWCWYLIHAIFSEVWYVSQSDIIYSWPRHPIQVACQSRTWRRSSSSSK